MNFLKNLLALTATCFTLQTATAAEYDISLSRKGPNLYKLDGTEILVHTRYCYQYSYGEQAILRMQGTQGEVTFIGSSPAKCNVKSVYGASTQSAGTYVVNVTREEDDWYEIFGQNLFIKTNGCISLAMNRESVLRISAGGYGTLNIDSIPCTVEGIYAPLRL